ncbi:hypothetical protein P7266_1628 [Lactococcus cremoris]|nr:hypothetical protein P7266_1628 [Lactococcus cremoris]
MKYHFRLIQILTAATLKESQKQLPAMKYASALEVLEKAFHKIPPAHFPQP